MDSHIKILVIGAGPAGLSTLKALNKLQPQQKYKIVCIQKQPDWSGQWNYTWRNTTDKYGQHVHSSMYSQLWTNLPKECFEFPDYTFQEHFGKPVPSYLPRQIYKGYFIKRFEKQDLRKYVKFNCVARNVKYLQKECQFQVRYTDFQKDKDTTQNFHHVIVATGHYSYPNIPDLNGIQLFKGKIAHCHEIKQFSEYKGRSVLVIGGSSSAEDVVLQCYKYGSKKIIWAYRGLKINYRTDKMPQNIELKRGLSHFDEDNVYFQNGQKRQIDAILFCTGYLHHYPFMEQSLRLSCPSPSVLWAQGLYMNVAWYKNPNLFYVGMGSYRLSQIVVDVQGFLVADMISGKHVMPKLKQMHPKDRQRQQQMEKARTGDDLMNSGIKYIQEVMQMTGYPKFPVQDIIAIYQQSIRHRQQDFITFRDVGIFKSIHTGQQSCLGNRTWLQMLQVQPSNPKSQQQISKFFQF